MKCQRCQVNEAEYLVYTETINLEVCTSCAVKALDRLIASELYPRLRTIHQQILRAFEQNNDILDGDLSQSTLPLK